jgi:hypothetical protein
LSLFISPLSFHGNAGDRTSPDCILSLHALAVGPDEGFFCGRPAILLHAEVMGLLLVTIKIMKYLSKHCV